MSVTSRPRTGQVDYFTVSLSPPSQQEKVFAVRFDDAQNDGSLREFSLSILPTVFILIFPLFGVSEEIDVREVVR